jgi:hypothetical protein
MTGIPCDRMRVIKREGDLRVVEKCVRGWSPWWEMHRLHRLWFIKWWSMVSWSGTATESLTHMDRYNKFPEEWRV